jgi:Rieske Fe-S protein
MTSLPSPLAPTRRAVVLGACGACAAGALSACGDSGRGETGGSTTSAPDRPYGGGAPASPAVLARLDDIPVGTSVAAETADGAPVLVHRRGEADVVAFSGVCTHQGCTVMPDGAAFTCPCHGSRYDGATGDVVNGPAPRRLEPFAVRVQDGGVVPA